MNDFGLTRLRNTINKLFFPAKNPATMTYLEKTADLPKLWKSTERSPVFGFLKIRNLLEQNPMDRIKYLNVQEHLTDKFTKRDLFYRFITLRHMLGAFRGMRNQFHRLLEKNRRILPVIKTDHKSQSELLWVDLKVYAQEKWGITNIGVTAIPQDLIIKDRHVLYKYALVFLLEMRQKNIDHAPQAKAGYETFRAYNLLGKAVLDIAKWLRRRGIRCQPNHPLGGLVSYVPLAAKAGLGWQGMNGLLITPEFGQRQRIAPIYIEEPIFPFTDSTEHQWIEKYCEHCQLCQKECPPDAIQAAKVVYNTDVETIGRLTRCLDPLKCHPQFAQMMGCSICVKVCPFSKKSGFYDQIKPKYQQDL